MRLVVAAVAALLALHAVRAAAQPVPSSSVDTLVAKALVEQGLELARAGRCVEARTLLAEAVARDPTGPHAPRARAVAARCAERAPPPPGSDGPIDPYGPEDAPAPVPPPPPASPPPPAGPSPRAAGTIVPGLDAAPRFGASLEEWRRTRDRRRGRIQLTIGLGAWGLFAGPAAAFSANHHDPNPDVVALSLALGPAVGAGLGLLLSSGESYTEGQGLATVAGMWWGLWNGIAVTALREHSKEEDVLLGSLVGSGGGIAVGALLGLTRPSSGQVALANSLAGYGAFVAAVTTVIAQPARDVAYARNVLIGMDAGLGLGVLVGHYRPLSRGRVALLDAGAALGATFGFAGSMLVMGRGLGDPTEDQIRFMAGLSLVGLGGGLFTAWHLTADMDRRPAALGLSPVPALVAHDERGWGIGAPAPRPIVTAAADGRRGIGGVIDVAGGIF
jgi:hypothetical protein